MKKKILLIPLALLLAVSLVACAAPAPTTAPAPATVTAPAATVTAPAATVTAPAATVTAPAATVTAPAPETVVLTLAQHNSTPDMPGYRIAEGIKARVEAASRGRITIKHYPGELLGSWDVQGAQIMKGSIDMGRLPASALFDPLMEFACMPYLVFDWEGARNFYGPGGAGSDIMASILEPHGLHHFGLEPEGFGIIPSTRKFEPLPGTAEMASLKIRVSYGQMMEKLGKAFGMMVVSMSFGEVPSALMLGTIDGAIGPTLPEATAWTDVIKYLYLYRYNIWAGSWEMNEERWNSLSAEDQQIIENAVNEALMQEWARGEKSEQDNIAFLEAAGVEVIELTPEQMRANAKVARDKVWPWAEGQFGKDLMDQIRAVAQPLP